MIGYYEKDGKEGSLIVPFNFSIWEYGGGINIVYDATMLENINISLLNTCDELQKRVDIGEVVLVDVDNNFLKSLAKSISRNKHIKVCKKILDVFQFIKELNN